MDGNRILIVDDEENLVSTLAERLTLRGFQVETATNGIDALKHVREGEFNIVLLDVKMPGVDGLKLLAQVKRKQPDLPIILFTGHGSADDVNRGLQAGACDYLMKPIDIKILIEKINKATETTKGEWHE